MKIAGKFWWNLIRRRRDIPWWLIDKKISQKKKDSWPCQISHKNHSHIFEENSRLKSHRKKWDPGSYIPKICGKTFSACLEKCGKGFSLCFCFFFKNALSEIWGKIFSAHFYLDFRRHFCTLDLHLDHYCYNKSNNYSEEKERLFSLLRSRLYSNMRVILILEIWLSTYLLFFT